MRFQSYITENMLDRAIKGIKNLSWKNLERFLRKEFEKFVEMVASVGDPVFEQQVLSLINKQMDTGYKRLSQFEREIKGRVRVVEGEEVNEAMKHWWDVVRAEGFPTLAFYPGLTVWLELDKLFQGQDINATKTICYAMLWLLLVSGKYVKGWMDWKKANPEEYAAEKAQRKGGIV